MVLSLDVLATVVLNSSFYCLDARIVTSSFEEMAINAEGMVMASSVYSLADVTVTSSLYSLTASSTDNTHIST